MAKHSALTWFWRAVIAGATLACLIAIWVFITYRSVVAVQASPYDPKSKPTRVGSGNAVHEGMPRAHESQTGSPAAFGSVGRNPTWRDWKAPPIGSPLAGIQRDLIEEANRGNPHAACRLAVEMRHCSVIAVAKLAVQLNNSAPPGSIDRNFPPRDEAQRKAVGEKFSKQAEDISAHCAEFQPPVDTDATRLMYRAALAGHVPSMFSFAVKPPSHPFLFWNYREEWEFWRINASRLLLEAAERGYPPAVAQAASVYRGKRFGLAIEKIAEPDPFLAAKFAFATRAWKVRADWPHLQDTIDEAAKTLGPEGIARAEHEAQAMVKRWNYPPEEWDRKNDELNFNGGRGKFCEN